MKLNRQDAKHLGPAAKVQGPSKSKDLFSEYPSSSVFIRGKIGLWVVLSVVALCLSSCAEVGQEMGLETIPDIDQRSGLTGTQDNPTVLDPFKTYKLTMAANECRFFTMKVPAGWFWKISVTAASRVQDRSGFLNAEIVPANPPWSPLQGCVLSKSFHLKREGVQALLGIENDNVNRQAILKFCQEGAPVMVTIESQVSSTSELIGPDKKSLGSKKE